MMTTFTELLVAAHSPLDTPPPDACNCNYGFLDEDGAVRCPDCNGTWKRQAERAETCPDLTHSSSEILDAHEWAMRHTERRPR